MRIIELRMYKRNAHTHILKSEPQCLGFVNHAKINDIMQDQIKILGGKMDILTQCQIVEINLALPTNQVTFH